MSWIWSDVLDFGSSFLLFGMYYFFLSRLDYFDSWLIVLIYCISKSIVCLLNLYWKIICWNSIIICTTNCGLWYFHFCRKLWLICLICDWNKRMWHCLQRVFRSGNYMFICGTQNDSLANRTSSTVSSFRFKLYCNYI